MKPKVPVTEAPVTTPRFSCNPDQFACHEDGGCIPKKWVCDDEPDCEDGSGKLITNMKKTKKIHITILFRFRWIELLNNLDDKWHKWLSNHKVEGALVLFTVI